MLSSCLLSVSSEGPLQTEFLSATTLSRLFQLMIWIGLWKYYETDFTNSTELLSVDGFTVTIPCQELEWIVERSTDICLSLFQWLTLLVKSQFNFVSPVFGPSNLFAGVFSGSRETQGDTNSDTQ